MKTIIITSGLLLAALGAYAAICTEGKIVVSGGTCAVVNGHCACSGG
jgi:hypothetical protein